MPLNYISKNKIFITSNIQLFGLLLCILLSACQSVKFINDDESLVREANVILKSDDNIENETNLKWELEQIIEQPAPKRFVGVPRDYYYLKNQNPGDTSGWKNFIKKNIAEPAYIFDTLKLVNSGQEIENYLRNKKGYYDAKVETEYKVARKIARTKYTVDLGTRFEADSIFYRSNNPAIQNILNEIRPNRVLDPGTPIDAAMFEQERQRIFIELQNRGYANFLSNGISIKGDSSHADKKVDVLFDINLPMDSDMYKKFSIGQINVFTDFDQDKSYPRIPASVINSKNFYSTSKNFVVSPRSLDKQIFLNSGEFYDRSRQYKTIRKLSSLSTYRFVKLTPEKDIKNDSIINYNIYLTPHRHKWIADLGAGAFFRATSSSIGQRIIGLSLDGSLTNRNALGHSDRYEAQGETGIEIRIDQLRINAINLGLQNVLTVPRQIDYSGIFGLLYQVFKTPKAKRENYEVATTTSFVAGYNFQDVFDFYVINSFNGSIDYNYTPNDNWRISLKPTGFNLLNYQIRDSFKTILDTIPIVEKSFKNTFFTGFLFKEFSFIYSSNPTPGGFNWSLFTSLELSGGEIYLVNKLFNTLLNRNDVWKLNSETDFSNFFKIETDWRWYKKLNNTSALAGRVNIGYSSPYGDDEAVPYIRQFLVGGPNSIRAWASRELGPGGYSDLLENPIAGQRFYQSGDFKTEVNFEYRTDLFWWIEGALFMDIGNVWTLREDLARPGAQFQASQFFNEIAIGWGWGIRFDFTYFNLRFDFGYKLKNPYRLDGPGNGYWRSPIGQGFFGNPNVGINYPF